MRTESFPTPGRLRLDIRLGAGEIRLAKSASASEGFARLSRTAAGLVERDFATSDGNGNELNSATKLTKPTYQTKK